MNNMSMCNYNEKFGWIIFCIHTLPYEEKRLFIVMLQLFLRLFNKTYCIIFTHVFRDVIYLRPDAMSCFRLVNIHHFIRRSYFTSTIHPFLTMEALQEKAKLADERIQQLKSLITTIGTRT